MNKKYIRIAISTIASVLLLGGVSFVVYELTHKTEKEESAISTAALELSLIHI